jgi:hypothetical protein
MLIAGAARALEHLQKILPALAYEGSSQPLPAPG